MNLAVCVWVFAVIIAACQVLDYWTTRKILMSGGAELNPVMLKIFSIFGKSAGLILVKLWALIAVISLAYLNLLVTFFGVITIALLALFYIYVVAHNLSQLKRSK